MDASALTIVDAGFKETTLDESWKLSNHSHAVHCCLYSRSNPVIANMSVSKALVSMQMRFDGCLGFPGGLVDSGQTVLSALRRELVEEINFNKKLFPSEKDYLFSHIQVSRKLCLHFYAKEISPEEFKAMEREAINAEHYGIENLGMVRVPLFTEMDGYRGLPMFLNNSFAGNARSQLLNSLVHAKLMSPEDALVALKRAQKGPPTKSSYSTENAIEP